MNEMSARAQAVFRRTYSRTKQDGTGETFAEALQRVIQHQRWLWERAQGKKLEAPQEEELAQLYQLALDRKALPTGRTFWLGGTEIARTRELSQFACAGLIVKTVHDLCDVFWLLLNGCGIGAKPESGCLNGFMRPIEDVQVIRSQRTDKGGEENNKETWDPKTGEWRIVIGDSGEAWAKSIGKIVAGKYPAKRLVLDFSQLRPEGSMLSRYGWRSSGDTVIASEFPKIAAIMSRRAGQLLRKLDIADIINHLGVIQTGRRGAEILLMDEGDPELPEFIRFKEGCYVKGGGKEQRQQSNNSILFWDKPSRGRLEEIFKEIMARGGNEPGFINAAAATERAPWFKTVNPCLVGDTLVPVYGQGLIRIRELDGQTVPVRDGNGELVEARFVKTVEKADLLAVTLNDGSIYRVTPTHSFIRPDGSPVEAKDLEEGEPLKASSSVGTFGDHHAPQDAYLDAWLIADGTYYNNHNSSGLYLYPPKHRYREELEAVGAKFGKPAADSGRLWAGFAGRPYADKSKVPSYVLKGDRETVIAYMRGAFQSDGHIGKSDKGWRVQYTSKHRSYLQDIQALLRMLGVRSRVYFSSEAGMRMMPDGKGGEEAYYCQAVYDLVVSNPATFFAFHDPSINIRGPYKTREIISVLSVEALPEVEDVYCCGVPTTHSFDLTNIHSGNCVEVLLADKGFCNLFDTDISKFSHMDDMLEALRLVARANMRQTAVNLDDGILQRAWHENQDFLRLCGTGLTAIASRPDLGAHDYRMMRIAAQAGAWSMADELGAPRPKNVTCVKPSGTVSKVMDAPGEGAHKPLGRFIFNKIVFGRTEPMVPVLKNAGYEVLPHPTQETMVLVKFPVENTGVVFEDFNGTPVNLEPAVDQLERYRLLQENWCDQNVSMTVSYDPEEVPEIIDWLLQHWTSYVGLSWNFRTDPTKTAADLGAAYLPQSVVDQKTFEEYTSQLKPIDWDAELGSAVELELLDEDCVTGVCPIR